MDDYSYLVGIDDRLLRIADRAIQLEAKFEDELAAIHPDYLESARNLVHYLALREDDIRDLQQSLTTLGLSSLGRAERNVLASLAAVRSALRSLAGDALPDNGASAGTLDLSTARARSNKQAILGDVPADRDVSIMVTLPREAAEDYSLVAEMLAAGMNVARINCAHDDAQLWESMIANLRRASNAAGVTCRVVMDLAGPKIRTGDLRPGPKVVHIRPRRDPLGRIIATRRIRCVPDDDVWRGTKVAVLPVPRELIELAEEGDEVRFRDTRGKKRVMLAVQKDDKGLVLELQKGAYIATGTRLNLVRLAGGERLSYRVGELPPMEQPLLLRPDDILILHRDPVPGAPAVEDGEGNVIEPAHISCRQPEVFDFISQGDRVSLNDGKINGVVTGVTPEHLEITVSKAKPTGSRLRADRGINFPDSDIRLPGLTAADEACLDFVVRNADAVSLSFVRRPADILALQEALDRADGRKLGLVIKIETKSGFKSLPKILLTAMRHYPVAVMIARGDLAVEAGWARLAELQEEILWFCEAAHVPVIWATQVLEGTAKKGQPSRAEVSDAALSQRADCVMLNKGPHILAAIQMLDNILRRMQGLQYKKTPRLGKFSFSAE